MRPSIVQDDSAEALCMYHLSSTMVMVFLQAGNAWREGDLLTADRRIPTGDIPKILPDNHAAV